MKVLVAIALVFAVGGAHAQVSNSTPLVLFDFTSPSGIRASGDAWIERSDTASGRHLGRSKAAFGILDNGTYRRAVFFSLLNPLGNRGLTSEFVDVALGNLTSHTGFEIVSRGQGEHTVFKIQLRHKGLNAASATYYEANFQPPTEEFGPVFVPFSDFKEMILGVELGVTAVPLDLARITQFGFKRTHFGNGGVLQAGPATLEIESVRAV